jgi:RNA polymerase sigma-70 factor (ECF subfamily)
MAVSIATAQGGHDARDARAQRKRARVTPHEELAALLREHGGLIVRVARSYESDRGRAEELVQDIHVAIWQALPKFRGEANVRTYVARIAQNRAITHVTREARRPRSAPLDEIVDVLPADAATPEDAAAETQSRKRLQNAVAELPLALRLTVTLALEGFTPDEVATVLGISASAASVRLHRAKAALMDKLKSGEA